VKAPSPAWVRESAEDLYENAPCGYLSTLPDGRILRVNRTFLDWTGYTRAELLEETRFPQLLDAGSRLFHETHLVPLLRVEGAVREIACDLRTAGGELLPLLLNATRREVPVPRSLTRDEDSTATVFRYMVLDATERRRYEADLLAARKAAEEALKRVHDLEALLPICAWCRRVQSEEGGWLALEDYLSAAGTQVTHAICLECAHKLEHQAP
jgi:PAS domain S-box-containing protein